MKVFKEDNRQSHYEEFISILKRVKEDLSTLSELAETKYDSDEDNSLLFNDNYPFHLSFDEMPYEIGLWIETIEDKVAANESI